MGLMISDGVVEDIDTAARAARVKHGPLTLDPVRACAIMLREGGEAMNEALLMTVPGRAAVILRKDRAKLYIELAQVAATAALIMHNLREEGI